MLTELESDLYVHVPDTTLMYNQVTDAIQTWRCKWEEVTSLTPVLCEWVAPDSSKKPGNIYMNYKRHKPHANFPGRLITSGVGSFTENLSAMVALELKPLAEQLPHVLIDTNSLLRNIDTINASGTITGGMDVIHVSWDVVAMFPSIPEELGIGRCRNLLDRRVGTNNLPTECVIDALKICLNYNISQFDGNWYRQVRGAAMGPHEACHYCDIAMSYFDEMVFSESNPCKKPLFWLRFRDDIYDPWPHGEAELLKFSDWLNTLNDNIKFTLCYKIGEGIEFLDTYIYDRDGKLETRLFSKPSDTHAYLPPSSCHPFHVCKNNPSQIARRVRKINSEDSEYQVSRNKFSVLLKDRGYADETIEEAFCKFDEIDRATLYQPKSDEQNSTKKKCFPLVSEFNPHLPPIPPVLHKYNHLLELDPVVRAAIPPGSIFASYRQPKSILDMLVHSKFRSSDVDNVNSTTLSGCTSCKKCYLCKYYLIDTKVFKSYHCNAEFNINQNVSCSSTGIIYLIQDTVCKRSYVGSSIDSMKTRMSNYKNHLKTFYKGCEMAQHFKEVGEDTHSLYSDRNANMRTKAFQNKFDEHLSNQIQVIIIEEVDLSSFETTKEKRVAIESREGFWQTQLRTLTRYGGLNKKDERLITNKRLANKFKAPVSSSLPTLPEAEPSPAQQLPPNTHPTPSNPTPTSNQPFPSSVTELRRSSRLSQRK